MPLDAGFTNVAPFRNFTNATRDGVPFLASAKDPNETINLPFDFTNYITAGSISAPTISVAVYSGVDASPSAILNGAASLVGNVVTQSIVGGLDGVTYVIKCVVNNNSSPAQVLKLTTYLPVRLN